MFARPLRPLEAALYGLIAALLAGVLLERLLAYVELAERTAMVSTVNNANAALSIWLAYHALAGRPAEMAAVTTAGPFEFARMRPENYLGARAAPDFAALPRGTWVYDSGRSELVYLPRLRARLRTQDESGLIRFRVEALRPGMALAPATAYRWE